MIVEDHESSIDPDEISKSQRKRDADAVRELGEQLAALSSSELNTIPLADDVLSAIDELQRINARGARKRQVGFLAKRLRQHDLEPIEAALDKIRQLARANTQNLHRVEQWRDRLVGDTEESPKDALTAFLPQHTDADRQELRSLQRKALEERKQAKPPAAARKLFKTIRDIVNA